MKFNAKVYSSLTGEPALIQDLGDKRVEIFYMNDTQFFAQYANKGKLAVWASDGKNYRLLIEKGYYESVPEVYSSETNAIWTKYFDTLGSMQRKFNLIFLLIALALMGLALGLAIAFDNQTIGIVGLVIVLISTMFQNGFLRKKVSSMSDNLQYDIRNSMGEKVFENAIDTQRKYYDTFYAPKDYNEDSEIGYDEESKEEIIEIEAIENEESDNNE